MVFKLNAPSKKNPGVYGFESFIRSMRKLARRLETEGLYDRFNFKFMYDEIFSWIDENLFTVKTVYKYVVCNGILPLGIFYR